MNNFIMIKKVVLAVGILALCAGQFDAFGSDIPDIPDINDNWNGKYGNQTDAFGSNNINDDLNGKFRNQSSKQLVIAKTEDSSPRPINHIPVEIMKLIFEKGINPRDLVFVCKDWNSILCVGNVLENDGTLHYSGMNPF